MHGPDIISVARATGRPCSRSLGASSCWASGWTSTGWSSGLRSSPRRPAGNDGPSTRWRTTCTRSGGRSSRRCSSTRAERPIDEAVDAFLEDRNGRLRAGAAVHAVARDGGSHRPLAAHGRPPAAPLARLLRRVTRRRRSPSPRPASSLHDADPDPPEPRLEDVGSVPVAAASRGFEPASRSPPSPRSRPTSTGSRRAPCRRGCRCGRSGCAPPSASNAARRRARAAAFRRNVARPWFRRIWFRRCSILSRLGEVVGVGCRRHPRNEHGDDHHDAVGVSGCDEATEGSGAYARDSSHLHGIFTARASRLRFPADFDAVQPVRASIRRRPRTRTRDRSPVRRR